MRDIVINNFRCYEKKSIELRNGINLLIGDNSVGKTSLLRACNLVINSFFSGYSDENTVWKSIDNDDFRITGIAELPVEISFHVGKEDFKTIVTQEGNLFESGIEKELKIVKTSKKNSRNLVTGLGPLKDYASLLQKNSHVLSNGSIEQLNDLPLYACFTTEDIHTVRKIDKNRFKNYQQKPSFGYYESFDCKGLLEYWIKRLIVLKEAKKGEDEINTVRNAIIDALGPNGCNIINDIDIRYNDGKVYFYFIDGRESESELLSDGYRRLVNIVMDIAFRCALLNKTMYGDQCYKYTHGTVIIDEIDEHLHPALQVRVLKALQKTFPKIQFIVSSHSPLVISSVESGPENVVYKLEYDAKESVYTHRELNVYGMDASTIIEVFMDQSARDIDIDNRIKIIRELLDKGQIEDAKKSLKQLTDISADGNPELTSLSTLISFFENPYDTDTQK